MTDLTDDTLASFAEAGPCILFYYTDWCRLCPAVREILLRLPERCRVAQLRYEDCPRAVRLHGVPGVPTVLALRGGELLDSLPGYRPEEQYTALAGRVFAADVFHREGGD